MSIKKLLKGLLKKILIRTNPVYRKLCSLEEQKSEIRSGLVELVLKQHHVLEDIKLEIRARLDELIQKQHHKLYVGGQRWELELQKRYKDELYLDGFGYKVCSQNDEDGIIEEIFHRIGTTNKTFIEFGVEDGFECNSNYLLMTGWKGLWIEGNSQSVKKIKDNYRDTINREKLKVSENFITKDNINKIFSDSGFSGEIDFLSVDIDGMDWYVAKSILEAKQINPRVICIEYNPLIPPSRDPDDTSTDWIIDYKEDYVWGGDSWQGASLSAYYHLFRNFGYSLVGTGQSGVNAFFVKDDLSQNKFVKDTQGAYTFYNPFRYAIMKYQFPFNGGVSRMSIIESLEHYLTSKGIRKHEKPLQGKLA